MDLTPSFHFFHLDLWPITRPRPSEVREGIGCGGPKCSTCVVGSVVVADAEAREKSGRTYRVRFFK